MIALCMVKSNNNKDGIYNADTLKRAERTNKAIPVTKSKYQWADHKRPDN